MEQQQILDDVLKDHYYFQRNPDPLDEVAERLANNGRSPSSLASRGLTAIGHQAPTVVPCGSSRAGEAVRTSLFEGEPRVVNQRVRLTAR